MGTMADRFSVDVPDEDVQDTLDVIASQFAEFSEAIDGLLDDGREKSIVITKLEEAFLFARLSVERSN